MFSYCLQRGISIDDVGVARGTAFQEGGTAGSWFQNRRFLLKKSWRGGYHGKTRQAGHERTHTYTSIRSCWLLDTWYQVHKTRTFARLKKGGGWCGYQSLFPVLYRLLITIILQDHPGSSRQTLRCFLIVDPRACGCAHNPPRCVSTPPSEKENLRRDYRPTLLLFFFLDDSISGLRSPVIQKKKSPKKGIPLS